jgi:hypothetical protein
MPHWSHYIPRNLLQPPVGSPVDRSDKYRGWSVFNSVHTVYHNSFELLGTGRLNLDFGPGGISTEALPQPYITELY